MADTVLYTTFRESYKYVEHCLLADTVLYGTFRESFYKYVEHYLLADTVLYATFRDLATLPSSGDWNVVLTDMIFGFDIVVAENYRP